MKSNNTFGVHFVLRASRTGDSDKFPVYARITVNGTICEFSMKQFLSKKDWNVGKGEAKPKNPDLRAFNSYLQETQGKLARHYGVPIETISKMLGHTKISTTMLYARVTQTKIGMDMNSLQDRLDINKSAAALRIVK